jgi:hypothetical protein
MDWFRSCETITENKPVFITDNYSKEGFKPLLRQDDDVRELLIIDPLLPSRSSSLGHAWRNLLKFAIAPIQVMKLRRVLKSMDNPFVFAHSTYYAFLASFCDVRYSSTPQGSEVLVRPRKSGFYKWLLRRSVRKVSFVNVDSAAMADALKNLTGVEAKVIQNGIDVSGINIRPDSGRRTSVTSIRGLAENYRITEILKARNQESPEVRLDFSFPFSDAGYREKIDRLVRADDTLHGRLPKTRQIDLFKSSICVLSVPTSDSSPRSVYEAIFCGAAAVCAYSPYIDALPACMRRRVVVVDLSNPGWFSRALAAAKEISAIPYAPSDEALQMFDQLASMRKCLELVSL